MNKFIASAGLVVLGAANLQAQSFYAPAPDLTSKQSAKPWSVSAVLRGFYDDNVLNSSSDGAAGEIESFGYEAGVKGGLHMPGEQTYLSLEVGYTYVGYFETDLEDDQRFTIDLNVNHSFNERTRLRVSDAFISSREPEITSTIVTAPTSVDRSVLRNIAGAGLDYDFTDLLSASLDYSNTFYDYKDVSYEPILNRFEHDVTLAGRWKVQPDLVALAGYTYSYVDYYGDDPTGVLGGASPDDRNRSVHRIFIGADTSIVENLTLGARAGVEIVDRPNAPAGADGSDVGPYVDIHGRYTYLQGSYVYLGAKVETVTTDVAASQDQEVFTIYGGWAHQITPSLTAGINGRAQFGELRGGGPGNDGMNDNLYTAGASLDYKINEFWSANMAYSYSELDSDLFGRSFDRNYINLGVTATY